MKKRLVFLVLVVLIALLPVRSVRADDDPGRPPDGEVEATSAINSATGGESAVLSSKIRWWNWVFDVDVQGQSKITLYGGPNIHSIAWTTLYFNWSQIETTYSHPCQTHTNCTSSTQSHTEDWDNDWENKAESIIYWSDGTYTQRYQWVYKHL